MFVWVRLFLSFLDPKIQGLCTLKSYDSSERCIAYCTTYINHLRRLDRFLQSSDRLTGFLLSLASYF
jgi:hypothetical protein